jgi:hypothetical protein
MLSIFTFSSPGFKETFNISMLMFEILKIQFSLYKSLISAEVIKVFQY